MKIYICASGKNVVHFMVDAFCSFIIFIILFVIIICVAGV